MHAVLSSSGNSCYHEVDQSQDALKRVSNGAIKGQKHLASKQITNPSLKRAKQTMQPTPTNSLIECLGHLMKIENQGDPLVAKAHDIIVKITEETSCDHLDLYNLLASSKNLKKDLTKIIDSLEFTLIYSLGQPHKRLVKRVCLNTQIELCEKTISHLSNDQKVEIVIKLSEFYYDRNGYKIEKSIEFLESYRKVYLHDPVAYMELTYQMKDLFWKSREKNKIVNLLKEIPPDIAALHKADIEQMLETYSESYVIDNERKWIYIFIPNGIPSPYNQKEELIKKALSRINKTVCIKRTDKEYFHKRKGQDAIHTTVYADCTDPDEVYYPEMQPLIDIDKSSDYIEYGYSIVN